MNGFLHFLLIFSYLRFVGQRINGDQRVNLVRFCPPVVEIKCSTVKFITPHKCLLVNGGLFWNVG